MNLSPPQLSPSISNATMPGNHHRVQICAKIEFAAPKNMGKDLKPSRSPLDVEIWGWFPILESHK
jgi:hypothetical protein